MYVQRIGTRLRSFISGNKCFKFSSQCAVTLLPDLKSGFVNNLYSSYLERDHALTVPAHSNLSLDLHIGDAPSKKDVLPKSLQLTVRL